jgi:hypothetical protein
MGYGEYHVASPEGRYGSVHSTISENENTGSRIKDIRVLFIAGAPHHFSRLASAFMYYLLRYQCWWLYPPLCEKKNGKEKSNLVMS